mmetsp:Transcript_17315/g.28760  ORF Transcript_17315/g.28760 Transcript_17315/m.28760 type:complete len:267 (-) Transcript_17315:44-844(-)|eukprot:CAMPEP_0119014562 /NCGR_PEP_ID=MMETSP1176-20130426/9959_1 /TAXON_ID=265551 /ORGANISM="Synedropsis recta cf, Strain CCMP1620" /LENGTH=266 /DNA_ID=CAMNT_0006967763 /DNA_START=88 /DNA_END=888 /DNA_ORIENTATION=-
MEQEARKQLSSLDVKRKSLELEADGISSELNAKPEGGGEPMGVDTPLVDKDGYPRGDIDVYRARALRSRLAIIRTDHKEIMKEVEAKLALLAAAANPDKVEAETKELQQRLAQKPKPKFDAKTGKWVVMNWDGSVAGVTGGETRSFHTLEDAEQAGVAAVTEAMNRVSTTPPVELKPFCRINFVAPESPAAEACMEENDLVLEFGGINYTNHDDLKAIGELVPTAAAEEEALEVKILRNGEKLFVKIRPKAWHGRGLLGCHIVKYE